MPAALAQRVDQAPSPLHQFSRLRLILLPVLSPPQSLGSWDRAIIEINSMVVRKPTESGPAAAAECHLNEPEKAAVCVIFPDPTLLAQADVVSAATTPPCLAVPVTSGRTTKSGPNHCDRRAFD